MNKRNAERINLPSEDAVVEVPVLLEVRLLKTLETAARKQGVSAGTLVRCLLRDFLCYSESSASVRDSPRDSRKASLC
jgi:hypothetical protein